MNERQRKILRSVSRSFYLSIRILPRDLRDPIGLAYLLARATDTIADTAEIEREKSAGENLRVLADAIQGNPPQRWRHDYVDRLRRCRKTLPNAR